MPQHQSRPVRAERLDIQHENAETVRLHVSTASFQSATPSRAPRQFDALGMDGDQGTTRVDLSGLAQFARECECDGDDAYADAIIRRLDRERSMDQDGLAPSAAWQETPTVLIDGKAALPDPTTTRKNAVTAGRPALLDDDTRERTVTAVYKRLRRTQRSAPRTAQRADAERGRWSRAGWGLVGFACGYVVATVLEPHLHGPWRAQLVELVVRAWSG